MSVRPRVIVAAIRVPATIARSQPSFGAYLVRMVLGAHSADWRPVRLRDCASVEYLNELLDGGWYLMPLNVQGLVALAFTIPMEPARERAMMMPWQAQRHEEPDEIAVVVLHRGVDPGRQKAVVTSRDDSGYIDMRRIPRESGWHVVLTLQLERDGLVTVLERDEFVGA